MDKVEVYVKKVDDYIAQYPSVTQYGMFLLPWEPPLSSFVVVVNFLRTETRVQKMTTPKCLGLIRGNENVISFTKM
jgi:hypothetical protein